MDRATYAIPASKHPFDSQHLAELFCAVSLYVSYLHARSGLLAHLAERSHVGPRSMPAQNPLKSERLVDQEARTGKEKKGRGGTRHL